MTEKQGFSAIEIIVIVATVAVIGVVSFVAYQQLTKPPVETPAATQMESVTPPASITSDADLDKASSQLDELQIDDSDSASLDQASGEF